jgi:hypothetical protein
VGAVKLYFYFYFFFLASAFFSAFGLAAADFLGPQQAIWSTSGGQRDTTSR